MSNEIIYLTNKIFWRLIRKAIPNFQYPAFFIHQQCIGKFAVGIIFIC